MSPSQFEAQWGAPHRAVFSGNGILDLPFVARGWSSALLVGGLRLRDPELGALISIAHLSGDSTFAALDAEEKFPDDEFAVSAPWSSEVLLSLHSSWLGHTTVHIFGISASWGVVATNENLSIIGARRELLAEFTRLAGGHSRLREKFLDEFASERTSHWIARALEMVGWER